MQDDDSSRYQKRSIHKIYTSKKAVYVYGLIDPRDQSLFWVGMTNFPKHRYDQHAFNIGEKNPAKQKLVEELTRAGLQPGMVLIEEFKTREEAAYMEKSLIVFLSGLSSVNLKNIEHKPDKTWVFKVTEKAMRRGTTWEPDERAYLIGSYKKGLICEIIAKELERGKASVRIELHRIAKAGFLIIRDADRAAIRYSVENSKYGIKDYTDAEKNEISLLLPKVATKYGDLNADHMKYEFMNRKSDDKRKQQGSK